MAKTKPGLPEGFDLDLDSPSRLGDYLDEDLSASAVRALAVKQRVAPPVVPAEAERKEILELRPKVVQNETYSVQARTEQVLNLADARRRNAQKPQVARRPERMQFNMRPETLKMFEEIVEYVQRYSLQDDVKASEILDAMIGVLYQAREEMAFNDVPRRGKWGTPTARAFPTAIGNAFARAVANRYVKTGAGE